MRRVEAAAPQSAMQHPRVVIRAQQSDSPPLTVGGGYSTIQSLDTCASPNAPLNDAWPTQGSRSSLSWLGLLHAPRTTRPGRFDRLRQLVSLDNVQIWWECWSYTEGSNDIQPRDGRGQMLMGIASLSLRVAFMTVGVALGGGAQTDRGRSTPLAPRADTSLFVAVVESFADSTPWPIQVDPRPLRADSSIWRVTSEARAIISPEDLAWRISALKRVGIATADAVLPGRCTSVMEPPDPEKDKPDCPKRRLNVVTVGLPRRSPGQSSADSGTFVRVLETALGPGGFSIEVYDYIMARASSGWVLQRRIVVGVVE